mgnify:CR=1 FL=1
MAVLEHIRYQDLDGLRTGRFNLGPNTSFVLYRLGDTLIDAGPHNQWRWIRRFIEEQPVSQLLLTHYHEDHSGNSANIAALTGVTPTAPKQSIQPLRNGFSIQSYRRFFWGPADKVEAQPLSEQILINGREPIQAIATPGHTPDLTCYLLPERGWLFSGDMYISSQIKLLAREEDLPALIKSTRRLLDQEFDTLLCPHRGIVTEGKQALQTKYQNLQTLVGEAQHLLQAGYSVKAITHRLLGKEPAMSFITGFHFSKQRLIQACLTVEL